MKEFRKREKPLRTFDELLEDYEIEFVDKKDYNDSSIIDVIDEDGNVIKFDLRDPIRRILGIAKPIDDQDF